MVPVRFASSQFFDTERGLILFSAFFNHTLIRCAITVETLADKFGADLGAPLQGFVRHRHQIERLAEELIAEERFEADGSILICSTDYRWLSDTSHQPIGAHPAATA